MMLKIFSVLCVCSLSFGQAKGQSTNIVEDNIEWQIDGMTDLIADVSVPYQCKFVTHGTQIVDWVQDNGNFVLHFSVTTTDGNWVDPSEDGTISLSISGEGVNGTLVISRSFSGVKAHLQLHGGTYEINHSYPIQSYEKL